MKKENKKTRNKKETKEAKKIKLEKEQSTYIDLIEKQIKKAMKKDKEEYNMGVIDGLILAINLISKKRKKAKA